MMYIRRELHSEFERIISLFSVIVVTGPRQSGKTTLCKEVFKSYHYVDIDDASIREQIMASPRSFLEQYSSGIIIDEIQHYPDLFSYIKVVVDSKPDSHFILTGSSNFSMMSGITESLAGRAAILTLLPLSLKELGDWKLSQTDKLILNGGYPAVWGKGVPVQDVSRNYYNTYIERDVRQLLNVKDIIRFQTFIKLCAGRVATEMNASSLSNEVGVSVNTIQEWLSVLEASYILFRLPPFFRNIGKRLVKSPKLYFYDTGLACFLLGIENEKHLSSHPLRGPLFENLVVLEFYKEFYNRGKLPNLFFYRDKSQKEVDLILEQGADLYAYEIKSAKVFTRSFLSGLDYFRKIAGKNIVSTQVIFDGESSVVSDFNGVINFRDIFFNV